ncbi:hypothetical protein, partial [Paenibacillus typhae]
SFSRLQVVIEIQKKPMSFKDLGFSTIWRSPRGFFFVYEQTCSYSLSVAFSELKLSAFWF